MIRPFVLMLALLPLNAQAQSSSITAAVTEVIQPAFATLAANADSLRMAAQADCLATNPALLAAWNATADAWVAVETYRAGPLETGARGLSIAFWPDAKGNTPKALADLIAAAKQPGGSIPSGADFAQSSVAARGIFALEAMLYDPAFNQYTATDPGCALTKVIAADLAGQAALVNEDWQGLYGTQMRTAGAQGNTRFLHPDEVLQSLFTAILTELEFIADVRIGRPLGTADRPRPQRAEARLSGRSQHNVELALAAVKKLIVTLSGVTTGEMFDRLTYANYAVSHLKSPTFADLDTSSGFFRLQEAQNAVFAAREAVTLDLGERLGVGPGFNALDGD